MHFPSFASKAQCEKYDNFATQMRCSDSSLYITEMNDDFMKDRMSKKYFVLSQKAESFCRKLEAPENFLQIKCNKAFVSKKKFEKITLFFWKIILTIPSAISTRISLAIRAVFAEKIPFETYKEEFKKWEKLTMRARLQTSDSFYEFEMINDLIRRRISPESCQFDLVVEMQLAYYHDVPYIFEPDGFQANVPDKVSDSERILVLFRFKTRANDRKWRKIICGRDDVLPSHEQIRSFYLKRLWTVKDPSIKRAYMNSTFYWMPPNHSFNQAEFEGLYHSPKE